MSDQLPEDLQQMQNKIDTFRKEQALKNQIGKYYSAMRKQTDRNLILRRIYQDKNNNVRVDEYKSDGFYDADYSFAFKSWIITTELTGWDGNDHWNTIEGRFFYQQLERMLNIPQFNTILKEKP